jgi:tRNA threonylcarbamoyladenosine modification (KEOPS) complex Cgi121 subunit
MEADQERVAMSSSLQDNVRPNLWARGIQDDLVFFGTAFSLDMYQDLTSLTRRIPDGVVVCDSRMIGGIEHLEHVLFQANDYWLRNAELARKKSIDLLMRITCQRQINDAIDLSKISRTDSFALFGMVKSIATLEKLLQEVTTFSPRAKRNNALLELDREKVDFLKKVHKLPKALGKDRVLVALKEKSALLVFSN